MSYDCLIVGGGPAGLSAALQCQHRGLSALVITNPPQHSALAKAQQVDNYLGLSGFGGQAMMDAFLRHVEQCPSIQLLPGRALRIMSFGGRFSASVGTEVYEGKSVILATGVVRSRAYPGEERLLGKGVSYCATCDGMLYRSRDIVVVGLAQDAPEEAKMLAKTGCQVTFIAPVRPSDLDGSIPYIKAEKLEILGEEHVTGVLADSLELSCQGVFLLRDTVAPKALLPGLELEHGYIKVDRSMATSLPGVFACGDCTGAPLQIAKAVGEGQMAAHSASLWLEQAQTPK